MFISSGDIQFRFITSYLCWLYLIANCEGNTNGVVINGINLKSAPECHHTKCSATPNCYYEARIGETISVKVSLDLNNDQAVHSGKDVTIALANMTSLDFTGFPRTYKRFGVCRLNRLKVCEASIEPFEIHDPPREYFLTVLAKVGGSYIKDINGCIFFKVADDNEAEGESVPTGSTGNGDGTTSRSVTNLPMTSSDILNQTTKSPLKVASNSSDAPDTSIPIWIWTVIGIVPTIIIGLVVAALVTWYCRTQRRNQDTSNQDRGDYSALAQTALNRSSDNESEQTEEETAFTDRTTATAEAPAILPSDSSSPESARHIRPPAINSPSQNDTTPSDATPNDATPNVIPQNDSTRNDTTPNNTTPNDTTPNDIIPNVSPQNDSTRNHGNSTADESALDNSTYSDTTNSNDLNLNGESGNFINHDSTKQPKNDRRQEEDDLCFTLDIHEGHAIQQLTCHSQPYRYNRESNLQFGQPESSGSATCDAMSAADWSSVECQSGEPLSLSDAPQHRNHPNASQNGVNPTPTASQAMNTTGSLISEQLSLSNQIPILDQANSTQFSAPSQERRSGRTNQGKPQDLSVSAQ